MLVYNKRKLSVKNFHYTNKLLSKINIHSIVVTTSGDVD